MRPLVAVATLTARKNEGMDRVEEQRLERWLLERALAWFADPEVASTIRRLAESGNDLGIRYHLYDREVRTLGRAWGLNRPRPSGGRPPQAAG